ncbi:MAG: hypothetical protein FWE88_01730 [Phycisphaerae bacterium]|nr:hypothetical protein [Phycisphaerae bacterium]
MTNAGESSGTPLRATPSKDPAVRMLIVAAMALGFGLWCIYHAAFDPSPESQKYRELAPDADINAMATYYFNLAGAFILPLVGVVFLALSIRQGRRKLSMDEAGIHADSTTVAWSDIKEVDAKEFKQKDILRVIHGNGALKLDGYLWQKSDFQKLVAYLEQHVPAEKITR